ncbi:hypothetical protein KKG41_00310 [Patescibacteria group bacterium]|nr:hypothetical protein [Patescibacteria group bacterium]MBU1891114.1 hypothetical protein [Patescibacteria group bacterium]
MSFFKLTICLVVVILTAFSVPSSATQPRVEWESAGTLSLTLPEGHQKYSLDEVEVCYARFVTEDGVYFEFHHSYAYSQKWDVKRYRITMHYDDVGQGDLQVDLYVCNDTIVDGQSSDKRWPTEIIHLAYSGNAGWDYSSVWAENLSSLFNLHLTPSERCQLIIDHFAVMIPGIPDEYGGAFELCTMKPSSEFSFEELKVLGLLAN